MCIFECVSASVCICARAYLCLCVGAGLSALWGGVFVRGFYGCERVGVGE